MLEITVTAGQTGTCLLQARLTHEHSINSNDGLGTFRAPQR